MTAAQVLAQRFGTATNMLCGPSESLLLADASADPHRLALDLVNEAEHGTDSAALVVTDSPGLAAALEAEPSPQQVAALPEPRRAYATAVLGDLGGVLLFDTMAEAVAFANEYAAEHLQVATADPEATLRDLRYAGEMLLGQDTPIGAQQLLDRDPGHAPDRRLRQAQRRRDRADVPDDDVDRAALARGARRPRRPDRRRSPTTRASRPTPTRSGAAAWADDRPGCRAGDGTGPGARPLQVEHEPQRGVEALAGAGREPPDRAAQDRRRHREGWSAFTQPSRSRPGLDRARPGRGAGGAVRRAGVRWSSGTPRPFPTWRADLPGR